jgi:hypothetical protein
MVALRYAPGRAHVVATGATVVLIDADVATDLLTRLWHEVETGRGLAAVLEALAGAFGTSLTAIPPFLVAVREEDGVRLAVRGDIAVTATGERGPLTLTGTGVTTWSEQVVPGVSTTEIAVAGADAAPAGARLPLRDGVVRADAVFVEWGTDAAPAAGSEAGAAASTARDTSVSDASGGDATTDAAPDAPADATAADATVARADVPAAGPADDSADTWLPPVVTLIPDVTTSVPGDAAETPAHGTSVSALDPAASPLEAIPPIPPSPVPAAASVPDPADVADTVASVRVRGDHDGETISLAQARALRGAPAAAADPDDVAEPLAPPRPAAPGRLRLSTGQVVALDRTVVIGRRPRSTRVTGTDLPHLIAVDSPEQDISRSHLEVRAEGDSILATDLHTTNGTTLRRVGADPVRLHPGERNVVVPGDVLDLGDGVTVTVEEIE